MGNSKELEACITYKYKFPVRKPCFFIELLFQVSVTVVFPEALLDIIKTNTHSFIIAIII